MTSVAAGEISRGFQLLNQGFAGQGMKGKNGVESSDIVNALVCEEAFERIHPMDGDGRIVDRRNAFLLKFLEQAIDGLAAHADHRRPVFLGKP